MKVYLIGPITGMADLNRPAFEAAAATLEAYGNETWYGLRDNGLEDSQPWDAHMRADIAAMMFCDAVYLLDGWERSRGARIEERLARDLGLRIGTPTRPRKPLAHPSTNPNQPGHTSP